MSMVDSMHGRLAGGKARPTSRTPGSRLALTAWGLVIVLAACTSSEGAVLGTRAYSTPDPELRIQFLQEEHRYPTGTPTPAQRREFILEEHGYDIANP